MDLVRIDEKITEVLEHFDFAKCHKVMVALDWAWQEGQERAIPSEEQLRATAQILLNQARDAALGNDGLMCTSGTGGLRAEISAANVALFFVLTKTQTHIEDGYWV